MKVAAEDASAFETLAIRLTVGAVVLTAVMQARARSWCVPRITRAGALLGVGKLASFGLAAIAIQYIDSGTAVVLLGTAPLFTAIFAAIFVAGERMSANRAAGLLFGFVGVAVLAGGTALDASPSVIAAQAAQLAGAAALAAGGVYAKRVLTVTRDALAISWMDIVCAAMLAWPVLFAAEGAPSLSLSAETWAALVVLGAVQTGVAWAAYIWLIERAGSVQASLVAYLMPPVGLFLGWAFLGERITPETIAGLALIVCGVLVVMRRGSHRAEASATEPTQPALRPAINAR
jgi:drug/metabolite transporter (DMT)-like permease